MASIVWDIQGVTMVNYLEEGCTLNGTYYAELRRQHQEFLTKRRRKLTRGDLLLQDNVPSCISQAALAAATKYSFGVIPFPVFSMCSSF